MSDVPSADYMSQRFYAQTMSGFSHILPNMFCGEWSEMEMDLMLIRKSGYVEEVEIKRSVADFKNDFKKTGKTVMIGPSPNPSAYVYSRPHVTRNKHEMLQEGLTMANRFSFFIPLEMERKIEVPEYAGLYLINDGYIIHRKQAPLLHKTKITEKQLLVIGRKMMFRYWNLKHKKSSTS